MTLKDVLTPKPVVAPVPVAEQPPEAFMTLDPVGRIGELVHKHTEMVGELKGLFLNNVLFAGTVLLDAAGQWAWSTSIPYASVMVWNPTTHQVTVSSDGPQGTIPTSGKIAIIPAGEFLVLPMTGGQLTVYGNPTAAGTLGDQIYVAVFNRFVNPAGGVVGTSAAAGLITASTGTPTSVASSAADTVILAANPNRRGAAFFNDSTQVLFLLLANAVSSNTVYTVQIPAQGYYELPTTAVYLGVIKGIWAAANGSVRVTELT